MYIRTKEFKNKDGSVRTYLQIVENRRINGKPTQKVIANLGRIEELKEKGVIDRLIASLAKYSEHQWVQAEAESGEGNGDRLWFSGRYGKNSG